MLELSFRELVDWEYAIGSLINNLEDEIQIQREKVLKRQINFTEADEIIEEDKKQIERLRDLEVKLGFLKQESKINSQVALRYKEREYDTWFKRNSY